MKKVIGLNPRESLILTNIGLSYLYLHDYDSSIIYHRKAIDSMPTWKSSYINLLEAYILKTGNTTEAWRVLETAVVATGNSMNEYKALLNIYDGKYSEAIEILRRATDSDFDYPGARFLIMAATNRYMGRELTAKGYYDSALIVLDKKHLENPEDYEIQSLMGIAFAGKGDKSRAIEYGMNSVRLAENFKLDLPDIKINLAMIYTLAGEYEAASRIVEDLFSAPSDFSYNLLQIDPVWKPLMNSASFIHIRNKYSTIY
jgi:tetratricopeptide (TPR) repeat protein